MNEWIKDLKVGDQVIVSAMYHKEVCRVEKITPTGRIKTANSCFNLNGRERGGDAWSGRNLCEATPEAVKEIKESNKIRIAIQKMREVREITYQQAVEILKILEGEE